MNNQFNEEKVNDQATELENENIYEAVIDKKENRRTLSVISLAFAVLSVLLLFIPWLSLVCSIVAIVTGAFSRRNLGYFDGFTLGGLIVGIFGFVFSVSGIIFADFFSALFNF